MREAALEREVDEPLGPVVGRAHVLFERREASAPRGQVDLHPRSRCAERGHQSRFLGFSVSQFLRASWIKVCASVSVSQFLSFSVSGCPGRRRGGIESRLFGHGVVHAFRWDGNVRERFRDGTELEL